MRSARDFADVAQQQSRLALDTLRAVIFDVKRSLDNISAGGAVRRRLLTTAVGRLEALSPSFVEKTAIDRHTATSLAEMGLILMLFGDPRTSRAGEPRAPTAPGASRWLVDFS
jgi:hypothetical protein